MANNANTPTLKQKAFAKKYVEYKGNASKAALEVYDTNQKNAPQIGARVLKNEGTQNAIQELLNKNGLDLDTLTMYSQTAVEAGIKQGKPTFAGGIDMLKFLYKVHNVLPEKVSHVVKEERKVLLSVDFNKLKEELSTTVTTSQALLNDL